MNSGLDLIRSIRSHDRFGELPILMITTRGMQEDVIAAMQARYITGVAKLEDRLLILLDLDRVLTTAEQELLILEESEAVC